MISLSRSDTITRPIYQWAKGVLPALSQTERDALEAGDTWWDAALFTGDPDWNELLSFPKSTLSPEEKAFFDGPVETLCAMLDDWRMTWETRDLPPEVWAFLKREKFFGMIIPKTFGGLGFSAFGHAEIVRKIATRSTSAAVTTMVPNSLGPGELLMKFGTKAQQDYWLPRLADGREIPAFGLTSPEAGSDAGAMVDEGVVARGTWKGEAVVGVRLNWHKRYITWVRSVRCWAWPSNCATPTVCSAARRISASPAPLSRPTPLASASDAATCRPSRPSRTGRTGARTSSFRWT